jgi:hypothetical protein
MKVSLGGDMFGYTPVQEPQIDGVTPVRGMMRTTKEVMNFYELEMRP